MSPIVYLAGFLAGQVLCAAWTAVATLFKIGLPTRWDLAVPPANIGLATSIYVTWPTRGVIHFALTWKILMVRQDMPYTRHSGWRQRLTNIACFWAITVAPQALINSMTLHTGFCITTIPSSLPTITQMMKMHRVRHHALLALAMEAFGTSYAQELVPPTAIVPGFHNLIRSAGMHGTFLLIH